MTPTLQLPSPLHVAAVVTMPLEHRDAPQVAPVGACWQPPFPSQVPTLPQGGSGGQAPEGAAAPAGMGRHLPGAAASEQVMHGPVQAVAQQAPPTQKPVAHSRLSVQAPSTFLGRQVPLGLQ